MPNRMIRDWTDSVRMDGISAEAERLFMRLIMKADDYGRFHADLRLLKANCFPLNDEIKAGHIAPWIKTLVGRGLIVTYESNGRQLLAIANYGQRLKLSKAKFPQMDGKETAWLPEFNGFQQLPGTSGNFPPEQKPKGTRTEPETELETETEPPNPQGGNEGDQDSLFADPPKPTTLPTNWQRMSEKDRKRTKVFQNNETMKVMGAWFGRKPETLWTVAEAVALTAANPPQKEIDGMGRYYSAQIAEGDFRRHDLLTLLNNWTSELDRARKFITTQSA